MTSIPALLTRLTTSDPARTLLARRMGRPLHHPHIIPLMDAAVTETLARNPTMNHQVITQGYARFHTTATPKQALDFYKAMVEDPDADAARTWALHEVYDRITKMGRVVEHTADGFPVVDCDECGARHDMRRGHCAECHQPVVEASEVVCESCSTP